MRRIYILTLLASGMPVSAIAQTTPAQTTPAPASPAATPRAAPQDTGEDTEDDVVITASRGQPGAVIGDIPPEVQLNAADIRSYGVSSISDLLTELAPQLGSGRGSGGRPVVLLDGKRISGFAEIRDLPTEAIARVDILPEEVALKYGYRADQKVVNIVLRRRFVAKTVELADRVPTAGGRNNAQAELDLLKIRNGKRLNVHFEYKGNSALTEAERNIIPQSSPFAIGGNVVTPAGTIYGVPASGATTFGAFTATPANTSDLGQYRTLLPSGRNFSANTTYARTILGNVSASANASLDLVETNGLFGLPTVAIAVPQGNPFSPFGTAVVVDRALDQYGALKQHNVSKTGHVATTLNGMIDTKWRWSLTGAYDRVESSTLTDVGVDASAFQARVTANDPTANPFGPLPGLPIAAQNRGFSTSSNAGIDALFTGPLFTLPAGAATTSIHAGAETNDFNSRSIRSGVTQTGAVSRDIASGQINVDVPLTSRTGFLSAIGSLSANFNLAVDHLSDFGTLTSIGYGANWAPVEGVRLLASVTDQDKAPSAQQLGNPAISTPNVRVFDYVRGTTATVTQLSGGNPGLQAENNHVSKISATVKPWKDKDLSLIGTYVSSRSVGPIALFPTGTAAIEAAFPQRFLRDPNGNLLRVDTRPINFASNERSELRVGFNFSKSIKSKVQKEIEAFRGGTGPNPFAGLAIPREFRRPGGPTTVPGTTAPAGSANATPPADAVRGGGDRTRGDRAAGDRPGGGAGRGGFGGGGGGFGGGGFGGGGGRGQGGGRLQFALYDTWHITDSVLIQNGGPRLDLLNGDATGNSGGQSRHEIEAQAGYSNNGTGARLSANYATGTRVNGGTAAAPQPLDFSGLATANLRLFADLGQKLELVKRHPWVRGARISLSVDNIFDSKRRVTDSTGAVPISYQPDYLDPLGRTVRLSLRKLFF